MRISTEPQEMLISLLFLTLEECAVHSAAETFLKRNSSVTLSTFVHKAVSLLMELVTNPLCSWSLLATSVPRYARTEEAFLAFSLGHHTHGIFRAMCSKKRKEQK